MFKLNITFESFLQNLLISSLFLSLSLPKVRDLRLLSLQNGSLRGVYECGSLRYSLSPCSWNITSSTRELLCAEGVPKVWTPSWVLEIFYIFVARIQRTRMLHILNIILYLLNILYSKFNLKLLFLCYRFATSNCVLDRHPPVLFWKPKFPISKTLVDWLLYTKI